MITAVGVRDVPNPAASVCLNEDAMPEFQKRLLKTLYTGLAH
jgi:hypothetical protein